MRFGVLVSVVAVSFATLCSASTPQTFLTLISQPGDYIGGGITQTLTPADGTFGITNSPSSLFVSFHTTDFSRRPLDLVLEITRTHNVTRFNLLELPAFQFTVLEEDAIHSRETFKS